MKNIKKVVIILMAILAIAICVSSFATLSAASSKKIDSGTKYFDRNTEKVTWSTYTSGSEVTIYVKEYEKNRNGKWRLDDEDKVVLKKVSKNRLRIAEYDYADREWDYEYEKTSLSAKSFYNKYKNSLKTVTTDVVATNTNTANGKIDSGTKYFDRNTEKVTWSTYKSGSEITINVKEYEKARNGKWRLDNNQKYVLKKINSNTLQIRDYDYEDREWDSDRERTSLSALAYYERYFLDIIT
ncbi:MAG: hypothetical protein LBM96_09845 [Methanobrevibacter sp.]|nr:hypothetical protein [Candidatus Methanoflexus mossambicus]